MHCSCSLHFCICFYASHSTHEPHSYPRHLSLFSDVHFWGRHAHSQINMHAFMNLGSLVALNFGLSYKRHVCKCIGYWLFIVRSWRNFLKILCTIFCKFVYVWIMYVIDNLLLLLISLYKLNLKNVHLCSGLLELLA